MCNFPQKINSCFQGRGNKCSTNREPECMFEFSQEFLGIMDVILCSTAQGNLNLKHLSPMRCRCVHLPASPVAWIKLRFITCTPQPHNLSVQNIIYNLSTVNE